MIVTVTAFQRRGVDGWTPVRHVECPEDQAKDYVKMFFDMGYEKVRVN